MAKMNTFVVLLLIVAIAIVVTLKCHHGCGKSTKSGVSTRDACSSDDTSSIMDDCTTCFGASLKYDYRLDRKAEEIKSNIVPTQVDKNAR